MYPDTDIRDLTESQKQTVSALSQMAAELAGGIASGTALGGGTGAGAGKNAVENNYLNSTEKSRQTELNHKQNLTPQKEKQRDALNRKDLESDLAVYLACNDKEGTIRQKERKRGMRMILISIRHTRIRRKRRQAISRYRIC